MRLATGPGVLAFQSHFVIRNVGAYCGGITASSLVMLLGGYPAFAILFVAAGIGRFSAARATEVAQPRQLEATGAHPPWVDARGREELA